MSARWLRALIVPLALAALAVPGIVTAGKAKVKGLTQVSDVSPFEEGCGGPFHDGGAEREEDAEAEVSLAVNPTDPENLVVAWMQDMYRGIVTASSDDGGRTWSMSVPPNLSQCPGEGPTGYMAAADPELSFGPDGTVYLVSFALDFPHRSRLQVTTSIDGGKSWGERPAVVAGGAVTWHDTPTVTADPRRPCHAYVSWTEIGTLYDPPVGILFSKSDDCGLTWSLPVYAFGLEEGMAFNPEILVLPDGDLLMTATLQDDHVAWYLEAEDLAEERYAVVASRSEFHEENQGQDLGESWSPPVEVAEFSRGSDIDAGENTVDTQSHWTVADVAPDGTAYVAFPHGLESGGAEIRVTRSTDGGQTWEEPVTASAGTGTSFIPSIAVAGDGTVGVFYYDTRNDGPDDQSLVGGGDEPLIADVFFAHSVNRGRTWRERHLAGPIDLGTAFIRNQPPPGTLWVGDYNGIVGFDRGFGAAFTLTRPQATQGASDIFFADICITGGKGRGPDRGPCTQLGRP